MSNILGKFNQKRQDKKPEDNWDKVHINLKTDKMKDMKKEVIDGPLEDE